MFGVDYVVQKNYIFINYSRTQENFGTQKEGGILLIVIFPASNCKLEKKPKCDRFAYVIVSYFVLHSVEPAQRAIQLMHMMMLITYESF